MRCIHIGLLAFCISISAACAQAPKHPLASVPADVPYYYHLDFEAMDKAKLGADLKQVKSIKVQQLIDRQKDSWCLIPFMELKSQTFFSEPKPESETDVGLVFTNVARQKLDVEAMGKKFELSKRPKHINFKEGNTWTFTFAENNLETYDLTTPDRWVFWHR